MSGPWMAAVVALWIVVLVLAVVMLGTIRRIAAVLERAEATLRSSPAARSLGAEPGHVVGSFEVLDETGSVVGSERLLGSRAVFLFLEAGCGPCRTLAPELGEIGSQIDGMPLYVVVDGFEDRDDFELPAGVTVYRQRDHSVTRAFGNNATPQAYVVDAAGEVLERLLPSSTTDLRRAATNNREEVEAVA